ncbi:MAG: alanine--tRNA ligase [Kordiimonas sp.]|nr:alanine--tRNA ligase [Kordiimonas sp.]|tara:strand:- start:6563 stop:9235 length:2673 start_codon:yes stop_codon:yes gene_type:complete
MKTTNEIRRSFLDFFAKHNHSVVSSSPLVPHNDPTLMFTNAGMVPFKNVFTGMETRDYSRAASSQKCVRAGGKHNDLDNVGYTARHHTFFEMLGNFSFGDYFKEEAIKMAWDLVHGEFGLNKDRLTVTVYHDDDVAYDLWRKIAGLPEERIVRIATSDNFWSMGDTGPCGPCSEIFYDHGEHIWGGPPGTPEEDGDRFVEIWNLVFMQYDQQAGGKRLELPKPCIDTGMGLERITAVMQGTHDNYETDLFRTLIEASADFSHVKADGEHNVSHRVIADHLRSSCFLLADGVMPSNEGRGYVLRRIMRRAMRHAHMIGCREPLMYQLVPTLISKMGEAYPELHRAEALMTEMLKLEETRFKKTLDKGLRLLDDELESLASGQELPGDVAFKLYDTYGFPLDLTQDALRAQGRSVDVNGFNAAMEEQKAKARASWAGSGEAATETVWYELRDQHGATEFVGYGATTADGVVQALIVDGEVVSSAKEGDEVSVLTNQTPFYGESGGQAGDTGVLQCPDGGRIKITDTQKKLGALHVHQGIVESGSCNTGDVLNMSVDIERRNQLRANHTATHILHEALRRALGEHVTQKGSLVAAERLRFDISHPKALTVQEIEQVEADVNRIVRDNSDVVTRLMSPDEAIEAGAMALFGEKYGDEVRVVSLGGTLAADVRVQDTLDYSVELCGGTHAARTGDIGFFKIIGESAVSAGVRRIEALTGDAALSYMVEQSRHLADATALLKTTPTQLAERLKTLIDDRKALEKENSDMRKQLAMGGGASGGQASSAEKVGDINFLGQVLDGVSGKDLRGLADEAKKSLTSGVVTFVAVNDGKAAILIAVTDDLKEQISAVDLIRAAVPAVGGKGGGGRPDMAQAGGPDGANAPAAIEAVKAALAS